MPFRDRSDAGRRLAERLESYRGEDPVVVALPRGGVPVAFEIARALDAPLDVLVVRKVGAPGHREFGIGAVAEGEVLVMHERSVRMLGVTRAEIDEAVAYERAELERRVSRYRGGRALTEMEERTVILVDDGLATGVTTQAAVEAVRRLRPRRLVLAVPVAAPDSLETMRARVDDVVAIETPADFGAVGLWYDRFEQTPDDEVVALLRLARGERASKAERAPPGREVR